MLGLATMHDIVKDLLKNDPKTRNSDDLLYIAVCKKLNPEVEHWLFCDAFKYKKELGLPSFESISRCRRKIQETFPELSAKDDVQNQRTLNEEIFKEYARSM